MEFSPRKAGLSLHFTDDSKSEFPGYTPIGGGGEVLKGLVHYKVAYFLDLQSTEN